MHIQPTVHSHRRICRWGFLSFCVGFKRIQQLTTHPIQFSYRQEEIPFQMELIGSVHLMSLLSPETTGRRTFAPTLEGWDGSDRESVEGCRELGVVVRECLLAQLESFLYDATTFIFVGMLDNVDDAENYGVEFEMDAWLSDTLTFSSRVGYLETNIERMTVFDLDLDDFRALEGRDQTKAPRWQYHFGLRWQIMPTLTGNVSVEGRDDSFFGFYHDERLDGYTLMNASLAYTWRGVKLRAWSRNLLNTQYAVHGLYFANDPRDGFAVNRAYEQRGEPRVYGIDMSYAF